MREIRSGSDLRHCVLCGRSPDVVFGLPGKKDDGICEECARQAVAIFDRDAEVVRKFRADQKAKMAGPIRPVRIEESPPRSPSDARGERER